MILASAALVVGLALLVWSADRFVDGAAASARHFGMPARLVGMVVVGFGTSAPELTVSALAAYQGSSGIALGNAYGSNIANIALILGITALISPIAVNSQVQRKELPILTAVTALAAWQVWSGEITRGDAWTLLAVFAGVMGWMIWEGLSKTADNLDREVDEQVAAVAMTTRQALFWTCAGLVLLILSSRLLVWGAIEIAQGLGISDLIIGLTIVAVGTSLPELASSIVAARKGEDDLALGNIIGSNIFNTLAVVGIAGAISPLTVGPEVFSRDIMTMSVLTLSLFVLGRGYGGRPGRIGRRDGALLLLAYVAYSGYLMAEVFAA
ncbi:MAG: calcium/sodium antiporter [Chromatiaceae bacterium]|nr:calcium/sodium antiporter [Chromatiaceae bacterium]